LKVLAKQFLFRVTEEVAKGRVYGKKTTLQGNHGHTDARISKEAAELLFGIAQGFLLAIQLGGPISMGHLGRLCGGRIDRVLLP
jgi:hypothetical protein